MDVLVAALGRLAPSRPDLRVLVAGRGDRQEFLERIPLALAGRFTMLGQVSEADKARMLRSVDVYCAPNTGQESFGVILLEAMAARTAIVASDLDAFRRVLGGGSAGALFATGDPDGLAVALAETLDDAHRRAQLIRAGDHAVAPYDWRVVVQSVLRVYELAIAGAGLPLS
jgi:phosphatidyl-myo-inositol alpha-mannosyltransferase